MRQSCDMTHTSGSPAGSLAQKSLQSIKGLDWITLKKAKGCIEHGMLQVCGDGHGQPGDGVVPICCAHLEVTCWIAYA